MAPADVRKGMPSVELSRQEFEKRYRSRFADPAFKPLEREISAIVDAAWDGYIHSRKAPLTRKASIGWPRVTPSLPRNGGTTMQARRRASC
jgi:hypothetical protein